MMHTYKTKQGKTKQRTICITAAGTQLDTGSSMTGAHLDADGWRCGLLCRQRLRGRSGGRLPLRLERRGGRWLCGGRAGRWLLFHCGGLWRCGDRCWRWCWRWRGCGWGRCCCCLLHHHCILDWLRRCFHDSRLLLSGLRGFSSRKCCRHGVCGCGWRVGRLNCHKRGGIWPRLLLSGSRRCLFRFRC
jgi:hypothetical protein